MEEAGSEVFYTMESGQITVERNGEEGVPEVEAYLKGTNAKANAAHDCLYLYDVLRIKKETDCQE